MSAIRVPPEQILRWCHLALAPTRQLILPPIAKLIKTYQWRHAQRISERLGAQNLDAAAAHAFIQAAAQYIRRRGLFRQGLSAFLLAEVWQGAGEILQRKQESTRTVLAALRRSCSFLDSFGNVSRSRLLCKRAHLGEQCNLTVWFLTDRLELPFLALSRSAKEALAYVRHTDLAERELLPSRVELYMICAKMMVDSDFIEQAKQILKDDWRSNALNSRTCRVLC